MAEMFAQNQRHTLSRDYVLFPARSGLRPGAETDNLLGQHIIEFTGTDRKQYLQISVTGKTGTRTAAPMERAKECLDRIMQRQIARTSVKAV